MVEMLADSDDRTLVIALMSGGGSALMVAPVDGVTLTGQAPTNGQLAALRRQHQRDEHRSEASVLGKGRRTSAAGDAGGHNISDGIRRHREPPRRDRVRPNRRRHLDVRGCMGSGGEIRLDRRPAGEHPQTLRSRAGGTESRILQRLETRSSTRAANVIVTSNEIAANGAAIERARARKA